MFRTAYPSPSVAATYLSNFRRKQIKYAAVVVEERTLRIDEGTHWVLVSRVDGRPIRHASADAFRTWFPRHVRDDVMGFVIAELAR